MWRLSRRRTPHRIGRHRRGVPASAIRQPVELAPSVIEPPRIETAVAIPAHSEATATAQASSDETAAGHERFRIGFADGSRLDVSPDSELGAAMRRAAEELALRERR
jgi:hypothetical protein